MKIELRGEKIYEIKEELLSGLDPERELAIVEEKLAELEARRTVLIAYKAKNYELISGNTTK